MTEKLPEIPDDDADFTPDLARKIIAKYQAIIGMRNSEIAELRRAGAAATPPLAAIENLTNHQKPCDRDGVFVMISRQALDEVLAYLAVPRPNRSGAE